MSWADFLFFFFFRFLGNECSKNVNLIVNCFTELHVKLSVLEGFLRGMSLLVQFLKSSGLLRPHGPPVSSRDVFDCLMSLLVLRGTYLITVLTVYLSSFPHSFIGCGFLNSNVISLGENKLVIAMFSPQYSFHGGLIRSIQLNEF